MWRYRDAPIRWKLIIAIVLVGAVGLVPVGVTILFYERSEVRGRLVEELDVMARVIGANCTAALNFDDPEAARDTLGALAAHGSVIEAAVYTARGQLYASYQRNPAGAGPPRQAGPDGWVFAGSRFTIVRPITFERERLGTICIVADLTPLRARLRLTAFMVISVILLAGLLSTLLSIQLQKVISYPILKLADAARAIAHDRDYSVRVAKKSRDELGVLVDSFNEMVNQVQLSEQALRDAYEAIRSQTEILQSVLDSMGDGVLVADTSGKVIISNPAARQILGDVPLETPLPEWSGFYKTDGVTPYPPEELPTMRAVRGEAADSCDVIMKRGKELEGRWLSVIARPLRDEQGNVQGGVSIFADVSIQRRAAVEMKRAHDVLEQKVEERTRELKKAQVELVETARRVGMAEIATSVLHNVGNVLNSINVSATLIGERLQDSRVPNLKKIVEILGEHEADRGEFLTHDPKGSQIPIYLDQMARLLEAERAEIGIELEALRRNLEHMKTIIGLQQSYAGVAGVAEEMNLADLMEDALRINQAGIERERIQIVREYEELPPVRLDRHRALQILINLISNARHALTWRKDEERRLTLRIRRCGEERMRLEVSDNGVGIAAEDLTRIFQYGFTTRKSGHGFGLHGSANAAREMGGSLEARSPGHGQGSAFVLELPISARR